MNVKTPPVTLTCPKDAQALQAIIQQSFLFFLQQALQGNSDALSETNDAVGR